MFDSNIDRVNDPADRLVDGAGRPVRRKLDAACPQCGAKGRRTGSSGFGNPSTICGRCGFDYNVPWQGEA